MFVRHLSEMWDLGRGQGANPSHGTERLGGLVLRGSVLCIAEGGLGMEFEPGQPTAGIISTTAISNLKCTPALPTRVRLDVKPGSFPNVVNIQSNGIESSSVPFVVITFAHTTT